MFIFNRKEIPYQGLCGLSQGWGVYCCGEVNRRAGGRPYGTAAQHKCEGATSPSTLNGNTTSRPRDEAVGWTMHPQPGVRGQGAVDVVVASIATCLGGFQEGRAKPCCSCTSKPPDGNISPSMVTSAWGLWDSMAPGCWAPNLGLANLQHPHLLHTLQPPCLQTECRDKETNRAAPEAEGSAFYT